MRFVSLFKPYVATIAIAFLASLIFLIPGWTAALEINPQALTDKPWAIITTHLVHLNQSHLVLNLIALALLNILFREYYTNRLLLNVFAICALTASLFPYLQGTILSFVGLSGVLHGVFAYGAIRTLVRNRFLGAVMLAALVLKLGWDLSHADQSVEWLDGASVAYWAHIGGALGGVISVPLLKRRALALLK